MASDKPGGRSAPSSSKGFYDALGHTIKVARTDLGIDRKELAEMAGISYSYLAAIENGRKQPSSQVLLSVAEALGVHTHELLASAEGRRVRSLTPSEEYPSWLLGRPTPAPRPAAYPTVPDPAGVRPFGHSGREAFLDELITLAERVPEHDRQLLLDLARKLAVR